MKNSQTNQESISEIKRRQSIRRNGLAVATLLVLALGMGSSITSGPGETVSVRAIAWVVFTCLAFALLLVTLIISYRQADERQQGIQLKAAGLSFMAIVMGLLTAQMLYTVHIVDLTISVQAVFIGSVVLWILLVEAMQRQRQT